MFRSTIKPIFRRFWIRRIFLLRQNSPLANVFLLTLLVFIVTRFFNPFSSQYKKISLHQHADWDSVGHLVEIKDEIEVSQPLSKQIKYVQRVRSNAAISSTIVIVLYTTVFHDKKFCSLIAEEIFGNSCPVKNRCHWTCDSGRIREADAIIFHAFDILYYRLKMPDRSETKRNAVWILWSDEPPSIIDYRRLNEFRFNWTIGYRLHSEVSIGVYGLFSKRKQPMSEEDFQLWIDEEFSRRKNGALWFVSNCKAKKRLDLFKQIQKLSKTNVEGYGRCVDWFPLHLCSSLSQCERDYTSNFKFYFSFESNTCRDYITEKFYKAFHYKMIPIVFGPSRQNYERFAPETSFLHVEDFNSDPKVLSRIIDEIDQNRTLFGEFHRWRKDFQVIVDPQPLEQIRMCELCWRLTKLRIGESIYYEDLHSFYTDQCDRIIE